MKNQLKIPAPVLYIIGIILAGFSIALYSKVGWGITVISSVPYTIFEISHLLTVGTMVTLFQVLFILIEVVILKQFTVCMLLTFITAFLNGIFIDFFESILVGVQLTFIGQVFTIIAATFIISLAIATLIHSKYPPLPDLIFLRDLVKKYGWEFGKAKQIQDITCVSLTLILSIIFLGRIFGLGASTLIYVLFVGRVSGFIKNQYTKFITPVFFIGEQKFTNMIERNLLICKYNKHKNQ